MTMVKITTPPCMACGETSEVELTRAEWVALNGGALIQDALPTRTANERELVKYGTHGACWDEMFGGGEDDDLDGP